MRSTHPLIAGIFGISVFFAAEAVSAVPIKIDWESQFGSTRDDGARALAIDASGNLFFVGVTQGGWGAPYLGQLDDVVVGRVDPHNGELVWVRQPITGDIAQASAVTTHAESVYIAGHTYGTFDAPSIGAYDFFVSRYDYDGDLVWTRQLGSPVADRATHVAVNSHGDVIVVGDTSGVLGNASFGGWDVALAKYDSAGNPQWTKQFGTSGADIVGALAVDEIGHMYLAGKTSGTIGAENFGGEDMFLAKLDDSGAKLWAVQLGSEANESVTDIAIDVDGNVIVTGHTLGTMAAPFLGGTDGFATKISPAGTVLWTTQWGSSGTDTPHGVAVDAFGNSFIVGSTSGSLGSPFMGWGFDRYIAKLTSTGAIQFIHQFGTELGDSAEDIVLGGSGEIYVLANINGPALNDADVAIVKMREVPEPSGHALALLAALGALQTRVRCGKPLRRLECATNGSQATATENAQNGRRSYPATGFHRGRRNYAQRAGISCETIAVLRLPVS